jgi:hypothetical protein
VGLSHERSDIAGAEGFYSLEGNLSEQVVDRRTLWRADRHRMEFGGQRRLRLAAALKSARVARLERSGWRS